jgi:hypothetical protein
MLLEREGLGSPNTSPRARPANGGGKDRGDAGGTPNERGVRLNAATHFLRYAQHG